MRSMRCSSCSTRGRTWCRSNSSAVTEAEDGQDPAHHRALLLNAFAQGAALMKGDASDDRVQEFSRQPPVVDDPARPARCADAGGAGGVLRASHLRQCGDAGDQSVRPVRGRAGQATGARAGGSRASRRLRCFDPGADRESRIVMDFDLIVIGAGSGGVRAARIAAAHGAKVAICEEHKVGGTCVIRGCVPKKLLVYGAHFAEDLNDAAMFGWDISTLRVQLAGAARQCAGRGRPAGRAVQQTLANHDVTMFPRAGGACRAQRGAAGDRARSHCAHHLASRPGRGR